MSPPEPGQAAREAPATSRTAPARPAELAQSQHVIVVDGVSKWFGDVVAVSDVSFTVGAGVSALLGPNGAGKSTMLRMLTGLTPPAQGTVRVLGGDPRVDLSLSRRIGLVPQQESLFDVLRALEFVRLAAVLHGLPDADAAARRALGVVELDPDDTRHLASYSKGMRQRVKVAQALVHDPEVIVLDEPLTGLDPRQRLHMVGLFRRLGDEGRCVVVSSHVLDEVERFGSRVLVMAQGRLAATGDFRAIRELMDDRPHRVRVRTSNPRAVASGLLDANAAVGVRVDEQTGAVLVDTTDVTAFRRSIAVIARDRSARLFEVVALDDDLDAVFRYLVEGT
jgi:ABC-2 type transport system ATP-binding protein